MRFRNLEVGKYYGIKVGPAHDNMKLIVFKVVRHYRNNNWLFRTKEGLIKSSKVPWGDGWRSAFLSRISKLHGLIEVGE